MKDQSGSSKEHPVARKEAAARTNSSAMTRGRFVGTLAAGAGGVWLGSGTLASGAVAGASRSRGAAGVRVVDHVEIDRERGRVSGHPRQGGIRNFGRGEVALLYWRNAAGAGGYDAHLAAGDAVLRRSLDGGATWLPRNEIAIWSNLQPTDARTAFLSQDPGRREILDMSQRDALFFFGRAPGHLRKNVVQTPAGYTSTLAPNPAGFSPVFQIRSADRGRTWERVPLVLDPPKNGIREIWRDNHPPVRLPDGAFAGVVASEGKLWLYGSENDGMTWQFLSIVAVEQAGGGKPASPGLVQLPDGRLQCYMLVLGEASEALGVTESESCFSWGEPRIIARSDRVSDATAVSAGRGAVFDAPWPLRLRDGRILVVFARREGRRGIGAILSEDGGRTWTPETMLREGAGGPDLGQPVAVERDDGSVLVAYGWQEGAADRREGSRFVAGSIVALG